MWGAGIGGAGDGISTSYSGNIIINGGTVTANGGDFAAGIGSAVDGICDEITINGGQVTAKAGERAAGIGPGYAGSLSGTVTLGWTDKDDFIEATNYNNVQNLRFADGKKFCYLNDEGFTVEASIDDIAGRKIMPYKTDAGVSIAEGSSLTKYYGDAPFTLSASVTAEGTSGGWSWTSSDTDIAEVDDTGKVTIKDISDTPVILTANYESDTTTGSADIALTVNKRIVTVSVNDREVEYNGKDQQGLTDYIFTNVIDGQTATITYTPPAGKLPGVYTNGMFDNNFKVKNGDEDVTDKYNLQTKTPGKLTITDRESKYEITVTANSNTGNIYDGEEKSASGFETLEFTVDGNKYTVSGLSTSDPKSTDACNLTNKISGTPVVKDSYSSDVTEQFNVIFRDGQLEISPRDVTLTSASADKTYDGTPLTKDGVTVSGSGFVSGEGATYNVTGSQTEAGVSENTFTYTLNEGTKSDNYNITINEGTLTVNKRNITLTSGSAEKEYNGTPLTKDDVTVGSDGFVAGEGATYNVTGSQTIVGNSDNTFTYVFNDNTKADNYNVSISPGTLKVVSRAEKYKISPQANSKTVDYDGFTWEVKGFETDTYEVDGNTYTVSGLEAYASEKQVGEHTVNVSGTAVVKDSEGNDVTSEFEVTPKPGKLIINNHLIQFTVTFRVINGEWNGGGSDDKTVTLSRLANEDLLLVMKEGDIPAVGNKPANGFKAGEWDIIPSTDMAISRDRVFTYTYAKKASISHTVTFKVVDGSWNDGTTDDITVTLSGYEDETLKLADGQIPEVGAIPGENKKAGSWDTVPDTETAITDDVTYTYSYIGKDAKSVDVTFKVVNGTWNDGTSEDKTVTLSGYEGDALKLVTGDIPSVGDYPATNYKKGSWNAVPNTDTEITDDTTYTYSYVEKSIVSHTVTFKVIDGSWNDGTSDDITVTLSGYEDETLKLADGQIPAVGAMPGENKKTGSWDTVPDTETAITDDVTCTYSYIDKDIISVKVTFKVENGVWNDGTALERNVTLSGYEGDTLKLAEADIPSVGDKPEDTYKAGGWDILPEADTELTEDVTYTYSYAKKDTVTYTAIFKVENGTWNDGTADDITLTISGYEGDTLKFTSDDIPEAGEKPAETFKAGQWDTVFGSENVLTGDTTYTYTYKEKDKISKTVTFKVKNGSWSDGTSEDITVTLSGYEGDILKLSTDVIPSVGNEPGEGYTEGSWDAVPDTDKEVTVDEVYTYTYAEKKEVIKPEYIVVKGADSIVTEGESSEPEIIVKRSEDDEHCIDHHKDIEFGGVILEKDKDYTVKSGSTIVTIKESVIKKLKPGVYTLKVIFDDGAVTTSLTVKEKATETTTESITETTTESITEATTEDIKKPEENKKDTNAATGDDINLWIAMMLLSMSGMAAVLTVGRKKRNI